MPDESTPGEMPDAGTLTIDDTVIATTPEAPAAPNVQVTEEEPFDRDRALATIRKMRGFEKAATELQRQLDGYQKREKEAEMARLSREEQLAEQLKQRDAEIEFERTQSRDQRNRYEVQSHAARLGVVDPDAAVKLLDWAALDYDADGAPTNVEAALKDLLADKPYLATPQPQAQGTRPAVSPTNPATRTTSTASKIWTAAEIADRPTWEENKVEIMRAMREGRISE